MDVRTVNNLPPAAAHDEAVRCLLAIELSKKSWIVAVNTPLSEKISRYRLKGCDWKGLLELIEKIRARVARELNRPVEIISCYEAGYDGFWLHRLGRSSRPSTQDAGGNWRVEQQICGGARASGGCIYRARGDPDRIPNRAGRGSSRRTPLPHDY